MGKQMRLIDAEALELEYVRRNGAISLEMIGCMPTIDAVPVVHGKWIEEKFSFPACSVCDEPIVIVAPTNYCPNCGAKMDGGIADDH